MTFKKSAHLVVVAQAVFLLFTVTEELLGADTHTQELHGINNQGCLHDASNPKTNQLHHILPKMFAKVKVSQNGNSLVINEAYYKWICHTDDTPAGNVQYVTLYNMLDMLPVYSAYRASPLFRGTPGNTPIRPPWKNPDPPGIFCRLQHDYKGSTDSYQLPINADYKLGPASLIDRGHLFAAAYASADTAQFKSTFKMTNVVAQDSTFNRNVWSQAERVLKTVGMKTCVDNGGQSLVVTGAVPENMNVNTADRRYFNVQPYDGNRRPFKVPVLMWTTMWCMQNDNIGFHISFIGSNSPLGEVMFYRDFNVFEQELAGMYRIGNPWQGIQIPQNVQIEDLIGQEIGRQDGISWSNQQQKVWESGFRFMRIQFLETLLQDNFGQMGIKAEISKLSGMNGNKIRKRRSTSSNAVQTNTTFTLVKIMDQDPNSDFKLTDCSVVEEIKETGKIQSHTIDMDKTKLIESSDPTGSTLTGSFQGEDGTVKEMEKTKSKEKTISIVLSPRTP